MSNELLLQSQDNVQVTSYVYYLDNRSFGEPCEIEESGAQSKGDSNWWSARLFSQEGIVGLTRWAVGQMIALDANMLRNACATPVAKKFSRIVRVTCRAKEIAPLRSECRSVLGASYREVG
jgi:hypothetical protein